MTSTHRPVSPFQIDEYAFYKDTAEFYEMSLQPYLIGDSAPSLAEEAREPSTDSVPWVYPLAG